ncbi:uncharacterized protein LOC142231413 [Haematobia irritans]|uniref:uncharacterized protein LOC142231413 n=1 Tax=Haematobia irritans TaxID=7368 RepID=UPI003F505E60
MVKFVASFFRLTYLRCHWSNYGQYLCLRFFSFPFVSVLPLDSPATPRHCPDYLHLYGLSPEQVGISTPVAHESTTTVLSSPAASSPSMSDFPDDGISDLVWLEAASLLDSSTSPVDSCPLTDEQLSLIDEKD